MTISYTGDVANASGFGGKPLNKHSHRMGRDAHPAAGLEIQVSKKKLPFSWLSVCLLFNCSLLYRESVRGGQTVSYFQSPKAKIFPCRRLALKYLMEVIFMPLNQ